MKTTYDDAVNTVESALRYHVRWYVLGSEYDIDEMDRLKTLDHRAKVTILHKALEVLTTKSNADNALRSAYVKAETEITGC